MSAESPSDPAPFALDVEVMIEAPAWTGAVRGAEAVCRRAAEAAVTAALPDSPLAGVPMLEDPGLALCVVLEDNGAVAALNKAYRGQDKPTNVLAFAALEDADGIVMLPGGEGDADEDDDGEEAWDDDEPLHLGDVILAFETVRDEAASDGRLLSDHLTHLVVHGVLHLLGHDHQDDDEAARMEGLETRVLAGLGIADPHADPASGAPA